MGDMKLVRPLRLTGVRWAVVGLPDSPSVYSRFAQTALYWNDLSERVDDLVEALIRFGSAQPERPVLFYREDAQLLLVSRYREHLAHGYRFVIADPELVEDLVDKARFQALAERLHLPVPASRRLHPAMGSTYNVMRTVRRIQG
jgi:predicted ATP-grasp superfamily ATP-dependent carboligase